MTREVCLDAGFFSIFFSDKAKDKNAVLSLLNDIKLKKKKAFVLKPVLSEVFYHLCLQKGKDYATSRIVSFLEIYPISQVSLNLDLVIRTGQIKCQDRKRLSYIDCMSIGFCLLNKCEFHTTEKQIKSIPLPILKKIKTITYKWD